MNKITKLILAIIICTLGLTALSFASSADDTLSSLTASTSTPSKVTSLKFTQDDNESLTISWPAASNASGYELYVSTNGSSYSLLKKATSTSYTHTSLASNTTYYFKVVAYSGSTYGEYSNVFTYSINSTIEIFDLTASDISSTSATVSWSAISGATYTVERYELGTWKVITSNLSSTKYTFSDLTAETSYKIRVKASVGTSTSEYAELSFTTTTVISWASVSSAGEYIVCSYNSSKNSWTTLGTTSNTYYPIDIDSDTATASVYRIYAVKKGGSISSAISYETVMASTDSLGITFGTTETELSWPAVSNATSYVIKSLSLDGKTWSTVTTVSSTSATVYLAAQSVHTLVIEAYKGATSLGNAVEEFSIYTPELYIYSLSDIVGNDYSVAYESLKSQLIYFTQVINNTKYYTGSVSFTSDSYFESNVTDIRVGGISFGDDMLTDLGMSTDDLQEIEQESLSLVFNNGYASSSGKYYLLSSIFVPFDTDSYFYNASSTTDPYYLFIGSSPAFTIPAAAGDSYINELSDGSYEISFEIVSEIATPNYHAGFLSVFDTDDLQDDSITIKSLKYGATTIKATFTAEGLLTSLEVSSPFSFTTSMSMTGDDGLVEVAMDMSGVTNYSYTFTY